MAEYDGLAEVADMLRGSDMVPTVDPDRNKAYVELMRQLQLMRLNGIVDDKQYEQLKNGLRRARSEEIERGKPKHPMDHANLSLISLRHVDLDGRYRCAACVAAACGDHAVTIRKRRLFGLWLKFLAAIGLGEQ